MARWTETGIGAARPTKDFAKTLRRQLSLPEALLWVQLKAGRLEGFKFRKQHPVGSYVLDFYCAKAALAVEVDGVDHGMGNRPRKDAVRDRWLAARGVKTLRLPARYVLESMDDALRTIVAELRR